MIKISVPIAAALTAIAMLAGAASTSAVAKSGGFSSSHSSYSSSSFSSRSSSSYSSYSSGFSSSRSTSLSSGFSSSSPSRATSVTGLGSALYTAHASQDAATTLSQSRSPTVNYGQSGARSSAYSYSGQIAGSPSQMTTRISPPVTYQPAPQPVYVNNTGGNGGFLMGWLLGHDSTPRQTTVIEQPVTVPASNYPPTTTVAPDGASPTQVVAAPPLQATDGFLHTVFHVLRIAVALVALGGLFHILRSFWSGRKAKFESKSNYRL